MKRIISYYIGCFVVLCLIFVSCATKELNPGEVMQAGPEVSTMTFNEADVSGIIQKAKPLIEEISGLAYKEKIKHKMVDRETYGELFADALLPMYKKMMPGVDKHTIARQVENNSHQASREALGMYFPSKKTIFLIPENVQVQADRYEIGNKDFQDFLFLFVAYRMVAVLDDQNFNLMEKSDTEDMEASAAFRALTEGHAVYIIDRVAERMKLSGNAKNMYLKSIAGITDLTDTAQQQSFNLRYVKGREFVEVLINKKGHTGIEEAFASPPVSMRQVMFPEEYLKPSTSAVFNCLEMMKKVAEKLPIEGMQSRTVAVNTIALNTALVSQGVHEAEAGKVTKDCINGASITAVKQARKPSIVTVTMLNFVNSGALGNYVALSRKIEASSRAQVNAMLNAEINIVKENNNLGLKGFNSAKYLHAEQMVDGQVTKSFSAEGVIDNFYFSVAFINPEKEPDEESVLGILTEMNKERLSMM